MNLIEENTRLKLRLANLIDACLCEGHHTDHEARSRTPPGCEICRTLIEIKKEFPDFWKDSSNG